ncbi:MAG: adenosine kinase [Candidatus Nanoarchaeia archaeon]|nr:adenosine kinase [Candidatus Nanoarchaeia archaeon]
MIELTGLTNALTDTIVNISDSELDFLNLKKGSVYGLRGFDKEKLKSVLKDKKLEYCAAGSPANAIFNAACLGLKTSLLGSLGNDEIANNYLKELKKYKIKPCFGMNDEESGICYIFITPEGERTQMAGLNASSKFNFDLKSLNKSSMLHTSLYELNSNPDTFFETIEYAREIGIRISLDLADEKMVRNNNLGLENLLNETQILFATEEEAMALTGYNPLKSLRELSKICPIVSLKLGKRGSIVRSKGEEIKIPIYKTKVINTCGAGDSYAAGFLFSYIKGFNSQECGRMGSFIASRVCGSKNSHLEAKNQ